MTRSHLAAERPTPSHAVYSATALVAPTLIATVLCAFDEPRPSVLWAASAAVVVALGAQQVASLVVSDVWLPGPRTPTAAHRVLASRPASWAGVAVATAVACAEAARGRPTVVWALLPAAALGVATLRELRWDRERPVLSTALGAVVALSALAAAGALTLAAWSADGSGLDRWAGAWVLLAVTACVVVIVGQVWWDRVVVELTRARDAVVSRRVMEERLRFAGELHDVQGHELQRILVQADLGRSLLRVRGEDALEQVSDVLASIETAARDALEQTRAVAHGYRAVDVDDEIANARSILAAVGVELAVEGAAADLPSDLARLTGLLVREATTNVLRHSHTRRATVRLERRDGAWTVSVRDDGPRRTSELARGSGLDGLDERAAALGYSVVAGPDGHGWQVRLEPRRSA
ncbi:MAG: histidine kinase [Propionibacteriales bacterium]|nr:histidine kinase [Propionibacteriales bacterium]